jgi:hypothetical protein
VALLFSSNLRHRLEPQSAIQNTVVADKPRYQPLALELVAFALRHCRTAAKIQNVAAADKPRLEHAVAF